MILPPLEIINCEQGSPEWFACRAGCVTASEFHTVLAKGKGNAESKTRRKYMLTLIGERITGEVCESYSNHHMERGKAMEAEARDFYAFVRDVEPQRVGFLKRGEVGCSPDSLIGEDGMHEIKTKLPSLHLEALLSDEMPSEHRAQVQGGLWISEREWCDFQSYWPRTPPFIKRVYRDDDYIKTLDKEVERFLDEMNDLYNKLTAKVA